MNLDPAATAKLHRDQLVAVIDWLDKNRAEWEDVDPYADEDGADTDGLSISSAGAEAASREQWAKDSLAAFRSMLGRDRFPLTEKQLGWVHKVAERFGFQLPQPPAPRGREVALAFQPGPKLPPGRRG